MAADVLSAACLAAALLPAGPAVALLPAAGLAVALLPAAGLAVALLLAAVRLSPGLARRIRRQLPSEDRLSWLWLLSFLFSSLNLYNCG